MKFVECEGKPVLINLASVDCIEVAAGYGEYYVRANVSDNRWYNLYTGNEENCLVYLRDLVRDMVEAGLIV